MVILYTSGLNADFHKENYKDLNEICKNSVYRNDMVYKECSYRLSDTCNSKKKIDASKVIKPSIKSTSVKSIDNHFSWTKVYKSPTTKRHIEENHKSIVIEYNIAKIQNEQFINNEECKDPEIKIDERDLVEVITQAVSTSVTSIPKPVLRKPTWLKYNSLPKFLCPCCCGGEDNIETDQSGAESYETINLKAASNIFLPNIDLDPSLMSIIQLHGHLKARKTPKFYASIIKVLLRNTYKNAIGIAKSFKGI